MTVRPAAEPSTSKIIGRRVRAIMDSKTWTAQQLVDALAVENPSLKWTVSVVMNLTSRRRRFVTVDEVYALARVLGVNPVDLLVPSDAADEDPYPITPNTITTASTARGWVAGHGFLDPPDSPAALAEAIRWMPNDRAKTVAGTWLRNHSQRNDPEVIAAEMRAGDAFAEEFGYYGPPDQPARRREQRRRGETK